ncbi:MAG: hypothetical protein AB8B55_16075 [Mariniblastus sp.]
MKLDIESLCDALSAELEPASSEYPSHIFRFRDSLLRYEMHVNPQGNSVAFAADPEEPMQACPLLEFSFRCDEIEVGMNAYSKVYGDKLGNAVRFWEQSNLNHREDPENGLRLTMSPRGDGRWYLWANAIDIPEEKTEE